MITLQRPHVALAGLGLGLALGQGCYDGVAPIDTDATESTGLQLCQAGLVTCPDGSCHAPAPGVCCGFGGVCPAADETTLDPTMPDPTMPPTTMPPTTLPPTTDPGSTTDETLSDTNTSSSTGDDSTSSTSSSTSEGSTTTGEMTPGCYDPLTFPWAGPLCGPAALPCVVQAAETIEPLAVARSGHPTVAVDDDCAPAVLHAQSDGGALGFFARRTGDDAWDVQATPFPMNQGGLDFDPVTGFFGAMVNEGGFQVSARTYDGVAWNAGDPLMGSYSLSTKAFALTGDATLHGFLQQPGVGFVDSTWSGAWMLAMMATGGATDVSPALAVAPDGTHHFTYWHNDVGGPMLRWGESAAASLEEVVPYGGAVVQPGLAQELALTDDGMGGVVPHVIAGTETGVPGRVQVIYARRDGVALWTPYVVAAEDPTGETTCDVPPTMPGEVCTLDRITYRPLAIAASLGGDVRWLYTDVHELVDYASECTPDCAWVPTLDATTYDVRLGWLEGGVPTSALLLADTRLTRANAEIDGAGTMHIVAYAEEVPDGPGTGLTVEYFRVGG